MKKFVYFLFYYILFFSGENSSCQLFLYANEDFSVYNLGLPHELKNKNLIKNIILEDVNGDKLCDLIFFSGINIYIYEQEKTGVFSSYTKLSINPPGAIDIGNVTTRKYKEILIMRKDGISYFKREHEKWDFFPTLLLKKNTIYSEGDIQNLEREYFAIDLDGDEISELILWGKEEICIYYKGEDEYKLMQSIPYKYKEHVVSPGIIFSNSPLRFEINEDSERIFERKWPNPMKFIYSSTTKISNTYLLLDFNKDLKRDLVQIEPIEKYDSRKGDYIVYNYKIYFLNDNKLFSKNPDIIISDKHGVWISPLCEDINNDGFLDFLKIETEIKEGLVKKQKSIIYLYLANEDGSYPNEPLQSIETEYFPLPDNLLVDINGDNKKDLILVHPISKGFSFGSIIRKFLQKGLDTEVWIFPFEEGFGFSKKVMMKKIKINFMWGIPINFSGDFNGDGMKDMLLLDKNRIKIFYFTDLVKGFSRNSKFNYRTEAIKYYLIKDMNKNGKSDLIIFSDTIIKILTF